MTGRPPSIADGQSTPGPRRGFPHRFPRGRLVPAIHRGQLAHARLLPAPIGRIDWPSAYNELLLRMDYRAPRSLAVKLEHEARAGPSWNSTEGSGIRPAKVVPLLGHFQTAGGLGGRAAHHLAGGSAGWPRRCPHRRPSRWRPRPARPAASPAGRCARHRSGGANNPFCTQFF